MSFKVVMTVSYPGIPHDQEAYENIGAEFIIAPCQTEDEIMTAAYDADAVVTVMQPFTRKVMERLSKCKLIHNLFIGYEGVDIAAATERGICVSYAAGYCLEEVSDHTMALILCCARKLLRLDKAVRAGRWESLQKPEIRLEIWPPMFRLRGQTLGLIGFGNISRTLVPKAKGFGLEIIAFDPYLPSHTAKQFGVELVPLDYLLENADYVSIHASLTSENRHIFGIEQFKKMKPTAYLINTARGQLVDEEALYTALAEGYIAGAGLDVLEKEQIGSDHPLLKLENVIITAHSAHYSEESARELRRRPYEEISRIVRGKWPCSLINPEVKEKFESRWGKR